MEQEISKYLLQLRRAHPFLATISLFATYKFTLETETFLSQGNNILLNPNFFSRVPSVERVGLLLHVTLHTALQHSARRGLRNMDIWNIAADIVVNNIILDTGKFSPPSNTVIIPQMNTLSVEQVYEHLVHSQTKHQSGRKSSLKNCPQNDGEIVSENPSTPINATIPVTSTTLIHNSIAKAQGAASRLQQLAKDLTAIYPHYSDLPQKDIDETTLLFTAGNERDYWRGVFSQAETIQLLQKKSQGFIPKGMLREIEVLQAQQLDWRTILWRFMAKTPCDYSGYDRRFIHQGLYLDQLETEALKVHIAVDTSASVSDVELSHFLCEVEAIRYAHPFINIVLYYIDADIYGPYELGEQTLAPEVRGGGGTNYTRFFQLLDLQMDSSSHMTQSSNIVIYLTDGFADFPKLEPDYPILWVVSWCGRSSHEFPFGETLRIADMRTSQAGFFK